MIKDLLNKLASQEKKSLEQDIFAPYVAGGNSIVIRVNKIIYKLKTPSFKSDGFGVFNAINPKEAKKIREAERYEVGDYLALLPKIDLILVYKVGRWLAYPANENSFKNRFKAEPNMVSVLMADNIEMLDTVEARFDGANFWFDGLKFGSDVERKEKLRECIEKQNYSIPNNMRSGLTPEEHKAFKYASVFHKEANRPEIEKRLDNEFSKVGAKVCKFIERGNNVEVQWSDGGANYTSVLRSNDLSVVTAGICLSGGDKKFDLQSLVTVCREGRGIGSIVHIGNGGMDDDRYWEMYGEDDE